MESTDSIEEACAAIGATKIETECNDTEDADEAGDTVAEVMESPKLKLAGTMKRRPSKRFSVVAAEGNPLAQFQAGAKVASGKAVALKVENLSDARPISETELKAAVAKIQAFE